MLAYPITMYTMKDTSRSGVNEPLGLIVISVVQVIEGWQLAPPLIIMACIYTITLH